MYKVLILLALLISLSALVYFIQKESDPKTPLANLTLTSKKKSDPNLFSYWRTFKSKKDTFQVSLPLEPHYVKDYVEIPGSDKKRRYEVYASEKPDGTVFMVSVISYPEEVEMSNSEEILKNMVDELMQGRADTKLLDLKPTLYMNHEAYAFSMENSLVKMEGITFLINKTIYVLSYVVRNENYNAEEFDHFINSFKFI